MAKSIAILFHEKERKKNLPRFAVWHLAEIWREQGITVCLLFGIRKFVPADLILLHVDLTITPQEYFDFAAAYPVVLNGRIRDIRKSSFSKHGVKPGDGYDGQVIIKSDLNYGGQPERKLLGNAWSRLALRIACRMPSARIPLGTREPIFRSPRDYRIFDSLGAVPPSWLRRNDLWIEKFLPEMQNGYYCIRSYHFLGNHGGCVLRKSHHPIINASTSFGREDITPDPEIIDCVQRMGFDFGKFDYVMHQGKPILLDTNKTPGSGKARAFFLMCREWAKGIQSYF